MSAIYSAFGAAQCYSKQQPYSPAKCSPIRSTIVVAKRAAHHPAFDAAVHSAFNAAFVKAFHTAIREPFGAAVCSTDRLPFCATIGPAICAAFEPAKRNTIVST
jgi:hypothetical protein